MECLHRIPGSWATRAGYLLKNVPTRISVLVDTSSLDPAIGATASVVTNVSVLVLTVLAYLSNLPTAAVMEYFDGWLGAECPSYMEDVLVAIDVALPVVYAHIDFLVATIYFYVDVMIDRFLLTKDLQGVRHSHTDLPHIVISTDRHHRNNDLLCVVDTVLSALAMLH